jgi:hypothetical protein
VTNRNAASRSRCSDWIPRPDPQSLFSRFSPMFSQRQLVCKQL